MGHGLYHPSNDVRYDIELMPRNFATDCGSGNYTIASSDSVLDGQSCTAFIGRPDALRGNLIGRQNMLQTQNLFITASLTPFPVEWVYFEVEKEGKDGLLYWGTANENNHDYFKVERSTDNVSFEAIGQVSTYTQNPNQYFFRDRNVREREVFYRIKQVDLDGGYSFSETKSLRFPRFEISMGPNPNQGFLIIQFPTEMKGRCSYSMTNKLGQEVFEKEFSVNQTVSLTLPDLASGIYSYQLKQGGALLKHGRLQVLRK